MHPIRPCAPRPVRLALGLALGLPMAACHAPGPPQTAAGPGGVSAAPAGRPAVQSVLNLYSASLTGMVVGAGSDGGSPGAQLTGLSFVPNPGLPQTYIWAFTPGTAILDRDCHTLSITQAINIAQAPVANAARFEAGSGSGGAAGAPVSVQLWAKSGGTPAACTAPS